MPALQVTFVNAALTRCGLEAITSFEDDNARARVANANYEVIVFAELGKHRWLWASKFEVLAQLEDEAADPWGYAYQLPVDLRNLRTVKQDGEPITYALMGRIIMTDSDNSDSDVVAHYDWVPDEAYWPPWWTEPLTQRMEAVFLRAFGERHAEAAKRDESADKGFLVARRLDSQSQTPTDPYDYPILAARRG